MHWLIDGNNVFGSRPDGWWNDRAAAQRRFAQCVSEWCRSHDDAVTLVFDAPLDARTALLAGGNLEVVEATRRGRDAADDEIARLAVRLADDAVETHVVTSDRGLRSRLPAGTRVMGAGAFRALICY